MKRKNSYVIRVQAYLEYYSASSSPCNPPNTFALTFLRMSSVHACVGVVPRSLVLRSRINCFPRVDWPPPTPPLPPPPPHRMRNTKIWPIPGSFISGTYVAYLRGLPFNILVTHPTFHHFNHPYTFSAIYVAYNITGKKKQVKRCWKLK